LSQKSTRLKLLPILLVQLLGGMFALRIVTFARQTPASPLPLNVADEGIFDISLAGQAVGTEKFKIRSVDGKIEAQAEVLFHLQKNGKTIVLQCLSNLNLDPQLHPISYTWVQKQPKSSRLTANFGSQRTEVHYKTVTGKEDAREFQLPPDVVVLDDNLVHHYQIIAARYQAMGAGKQTLHAFVPQEALPGLLTLVDLGSSPATLHGKTTDLRHLFITTDLAQVDLWVDNQQHIQRISVPATNFEAIRRK